MHTAIDPAMNHQSRNGASPLVGTLVGQPASEKGHPPLALAPPTCSLKSLLTAVNHWQIRNLEMLMINRYKVIDCQLIISGDSMKYMWMIDKLLMVFCGYLESAKTKNVSLTTFAMVWPALSRGLYLWWKAHQGQRGGGGSYQAVSAMAAWPSFTQNERTKMDAGRHLSTVWRRGGLSACK